MEPRRNNSHKISVALCTFNGAKYLGEQLESIRRQSRLPDELVCCDDASTDGTLAILREFAASSPFLVRIYSNDVNLRSTANFQQAVKHCTGDLIVLADQDDRWRNDKLQCLHDVFASSPEAAIVFSDANLIDADGESLGHRLWESVGFSNALQRLWIAGRPYEILLKQNVVTGATMAFRATWRDQILPFPKNWVHDAWITFYVALAGGQIELMREPLIDYRQHPEQQIGVQQETRNLRQKINYARNLSAAKFETIVDEFEVAEDRARRFLGAEHYRVRLIGGKIQHLKQRAAVKRFRGLKAMSAFTSLLSGHYHRYSLGWRSFFLDASYLLPDWLLGKTG